jgi:DNA-directed RNA polymerase subunit RPC12/RpoP
MASERYWSSVRNVSDLMLISEKGIERCPTCSYWLFVSPRFPHTRDRRSIGVAIVVFSIGAKAYLHNSVSHPEDTVEFPY